MCTCNAVLAALYNIKINRLSVKGKTYVAKMTEKANQMAKEAITYEQKILSMSTLLQKHAYSILGTIIQKRSCKNEKEFYCDD